MMKKKLHERKNESTDWKKVDKIDVDKIMQKLNFKDIQSLLRSPLTKGIITKEFYKNVNNILKPESCSLAAMYIADCWLSTIYELIWMPRNKNLKNETNFIWKSVPSQKPNTIILQKKRPFENNEKEGPMKKRRMERNNLMTKHIELITRRNTYIKDKKLDKRERLDNVNVNLKKRKRNLNEDIYDSNFKNGVDI